MKLKVEDIKAGQFVYHFDNGYDRLWKELITCCYIHREDNVLRPREVIGFTPNLKNYIYGNSIESNPDSWHELTPLIKFQLEDKVAIYEPVENQEEYELICRNLHKDGGFFVKSTFHPYFITSCRIRFVDYWSKEKHHERLWTENYQSIYLLNGN